MMNDRAGERSGSAERAHADFFVSYTQADRQWAEWIGWQLEAAGYRVLIQDWDFGPGSNFVLEMNKATTKAARTIVVLSKDYVTSAFGQSEWAAAFAGDPTGEGRKLLPVRVGDFKPSGLLAQVVWTDLVDCAEDTASQKLLAAARGKRAKPPSAPAFPPSFSDPSAKKPVFPASFPSIWNVPVRNRNFTGREEWLKRLEQELASGERAVVTQAISGLGGIGKTQLAIEFAHRHRADYRLVWWVRAETVDARTGDLMDLVRRLALPQPDSPSVEGLIASVRLWLEQNTEWLLIFDNVETPGDIADVLPRAGVGHVIVTSRFRAWGNTAKVLNMAVWEPAEAIGYLLQRTGQENKAAASSLASELGCLPLALAQAAAYIDECQITIAQYLDLFQRGRERLLQVKSGKSAIATIWNLSLQAVARQSRDAVNLLQLLAFLPPDNFPRERLIQRNVGGLPSSLATLLGSELELNEAIAVLRRYSLVEATPERLSLHRLVQLVVRENLPDGEFRQLASLAKQIEDGPAEQPTDIEDNVSGLPIHAHEPSSFMDNRETDKHSLTQASTPQVDLLTRRQTILGGATLAASASIVLGDAYNQPEQQPSVPSRASQSDTSFSESANWSTIGFSPATPTIGVAWFKERFGNQLKARLERTPFSVDFLVAIALTETFDVWRYLPRSMPDAEFLELCVGDTLDSDKGRNAFPKTKTELLNAPMGGEMFRIAHEALEKVASFNPVYRSVAARSDKFVHSFGIYPYDLQFFLVDPKFFLDREWRDFTKCLERTVTELFKAKARAGIDKDALTDYESVGVAIAYKTGKFTPSLGLKQGSLGADAKFYGERIFDNLRFVREQSKPKIPGVIMPRKPGTITTRTELAGPHSLNEPDQPARVGKTAAERVADLGRIINWLAVDNELHKRYRPRDGSTFPNVYTHDYCHLAGVYLPRVWWTPKAIEDLTQGKSVEPLYNATIEEVRANGLFRWLRDFGPLFGWRQTGTLSKVQQEVNQGAIGLIVALRRDDGRPGHIAAVVPETTDKVASRNVAGEVIAPVQSQAGARNFRYGTGMLNWWKDDAFAESGFWIHD